MAEKEEEEILVFGYACKLFRDDEKARQVDTEHFSVPWMGDASLKIDRFDGRGHLHDLKSHESLRSELKPEEYLSPEDILIEEMCNDERYRAMRIADEAEADFQKEELDKRVQASGAEVNFDYNNAGGASKESKDSSSVSLHQLATVIEKTCEFIATQGAQMEILMRAKEAHNAKFQFLNPGNPYHAIYKQVLDKKKARVSSKASGRLMPNLPEVPSVEEVEQSLRNLTRNLPSAAPGLAPNAASSSSNNAYSKLVEKIRVNLPPPPPPKPQVSQAEVKKDASEDKSETEAESKIIVQVPPYEEQRLIDQTASYVCRNGGEKLGILRKRMPDKFAFLRSDNKFNTYYQFKVSLYHEMKTERHREQKAKAIANANLATAALQDPTKHFPKLKGFFR